MLSAFVSLEIVNLAWAYSKMAILDKPLRDSLSSAALPRLTEFEEQNLTQTAWSLAAWSVLHMPLMNSLAGPSEKKLSRLAGAMRCYYCMPIVAVDILWAKFFKPIVVFRSM
jgi:hypothetical protein